MSQDPLRDTLIAFAELLKPDGIELIIGGGYGLLLRSELTARRGHSSRLGIDTVVRSTSDLDCFIGSAVISDADKTRRIAIALETLGFSAMQNYWQFSKPVKLPDNDFVDVHIDLLAADVPPPLIGNIHGANDKRRLRPHGFDKLHGRRTPEAVTIERYAARIDVSGDGSGTCVLVPHPLSFILMKPFAFRDRIARASYDHGAYHAFDILQTLDSMSQEEWAQAGELIRDPAAAGTAAEARQIVQNLFASPFADGCVRMVEYARTREGLAVPVEQISQFTSELRDLLHV